MKLFYETSYRIYSERVKAPLTFFVLSDIHFSADIPEERLQLCVTETKRQKPDYILIPGDLIDYQDCLEDSKNLTRLCSWLEQLGKIAPTLISLGNHDFYYFPPKGQKGWLTKFPAKLIEAIHPLENVHLLNNAAFEDDKVYIYGFTQSVEYYQLHGTNEKKTNIFHPGNESKAVLMHDIENLPQEELHKLSAKKVRIALVHSPVYMQDEDVLEAFAEFDLTISGHMHNGAVPPILQDFWRSDKGLIAPGNALFPIRARSSLKNAGDKNIICGAVTTIHDRNPARLLNKVFPIFTTRIELSKNDLYKRRPKITTKYINPKNV